jgi:hypothetical protein
MVELQFQCCCCFFLSVCRGTKTKSIKRTTEWLMMDCNSHRRSEPSAKTLDHKSCSRASKSSLVAVVLLHCLEKLLGTDKPPWTGEVVVARTVLEFVNIALCSVDVVPEGFGLLLWLCVGIIVRHHHKPREHGDALFAFPQRHEALLLQTATAKNARATTCVADVSKAASRRQRAARPHSATHLLLLPSIMPKSSSAQQAPVSSCSSAPPAPRAAPRAAPPAPPPPRPTPPPPPKHSPPRLPILPRTPAPPPRPVPPPRRALRAG